MAEKGFIFPEPSADSLCFSIRAAVLEYKDRHNGEFPAQITMTLRVYDKLIKSVTVRYDAELLTMFGIPVAVIPGDGYNVRLAEPDIPIREIQKYVPQIVLPPDYTAEEGNR